MQTVPYTINLREGEDGVEYPNEALWTPTGKDAEESGFITFHGLLIVGMGQEDEFPSTFVALGHGHTWTAMYQGATTYMQRVYGWPSLHGPRGEEPADPARTPLPKARHAVFIRHPHPDHPCGCEWDGQWRIEYVPEGEPRSIAVTVMDSPAGAR